MRSFTFLLFASMVILTGCSICAPGYLEDYATVGGKWQRADPAYGRVGSILSDPGSTVVDPVNGQIVEAVPGNAMSDPTYAAPIVDGEIYESVVPGESFTDPSYGEGVIILGDDW